MAARNKMAIAAERSLPVPFHTHRKASRLQPLNTLYAWTAFTVNLTVLQIFWGSSAFYLVFIHSLLCRRLRWLHDSLWAHITVKQSQPINTPRRVRAKLHYTDTGYADHQRTSSQQFYNKFATSQWQSPTSRHVNMLGCGKLLSVGGEFVVQQVVEYCCQLVRWWCS